MKISVYGYKKLNFVELNVTGTEDTHNKCDPEFRYVDCVDFVIDQDRILWVIGY